MDTFDPTQTTLIIGGNIITGFMDSTYVKVTRVEDSYMTMVGADGRVARARNANRMAEVEVTLMHTSPSNDVLSALHNRDALTGVPAGPFSLSDRLSRTNLNGADCFVKKPADVEYAKEVVARVWTIVVPVLDGVVGGA